MRAILFHNRTELQNGLIQVITLGSMLTLIGHTTTTASGTNKAWTPQAGLSVKKGGISYNGTGAQNTSVANYS